MRRPRRSGRRRRASRPALPTGGAVSPDGGGRGRRGRPRRPSVRPVRWRDGRDGRSRRAATPVPEVMEPPSKLGGGLTDDEPVVLAGKHPDQLSNVTVSPVSRASTAPPRAMRTLSADHGGRVEPGSCPVARRASFGRSWRPAWPWRSVAAGSSCPCSEHTQGVCPGSRTPGIRMCGGSGASNTAAPDVRAPIRRDSACPYQIRVRTTTTGSHYPVGAGRAGRPTSGHAERCGFAAPFCRRGAQ